MPGKRYSLIDWDVNDYFLGKVRRKLQADQRCAYLEILFMMYRQPDGIIDCDLDDFAAFTGVEQARLGPVIEVFTKTPDGRITHPHVLAFLAKMARISTRKSKAGLKGAEASASVRRARNKVARASTCLKSGAPDPDPDPDPYPDPDPVPLTPVFDRTSVAGTRPPGQPPIASDHGGRTNYIPPRTPGSTVPRRAPADTRPRSSLRQLEGGGAPCPPGLLADTLAALPDEEPPTDTRYETEEFQ
jgi:hypothetical protein